MLIPDPAALKAALPRGMRLLGLDVGDKTLGLALSDVSCTIASPYDNWRRGKLGKDVEAFKTVIARENIGGIVVGLPREMDGGEGRQAQSVRQYAFNLDAALGLPVMLWDERLSTAAVTRVMLDADLSRERRREIKDKLAASYILQGALDALRQAG